jgi:hypothetical protein
MSFSQNSDWSKKIRGKWLNAANFEANPGVLGKALILNRLLKAYGELREGYAPQAIKTTTSVSGSSRQPERCGRVSLLSACPRAAPALNL